MTITREMVDSFYAYMDQHVKAVLHFYDIIRDNYWLDIPILPTHDKSKYSTREFAGFVVYSWSRRTGCTLTHSDRLIIKRAKDHHYAVNPHHFQYWGRKQFNMPVEVVAEMIADWSAMGSPRLYWEKVRQYELLNFGDDVSSCIDQMLTIVETKGALYE